MDTHDSWKDHADWFPDWMPDRPKLFWIGVWHHFASGTLKPPDYQEIVRGAKAELGQDLHVSQTTFERARKEFPALIPKPSTLRKGMRPPWVDDPRLLEAFVPQGVTLPLPFVLDDEQIETPLLRVGQHEIILLKGGMVRWRPLSAVAAALAVVPLLDLVSDGKLDGVIMWCHLLLPRALRG